MKKELSKREKEVLKLISEGDTSAVIGGKLGISKRTIEVHTSNMFRKTGAKNKPHLVAMHYEAKLYCIELSHVNFDVIPKL